MARAGPRKARTPYAAPAMATAGRRAGAAALDAAATAKLAALIPSWCSDRARQEFPGQLRYWAQTTSATRQSRQKNSAAECRRRLDAVILAANSLRAAISALPSAVQAMIGGVIDGGEPKAYRRIELARRALKPAATAADLLEALGVAAREEMEQGKPGPRDVDAIEDMRLLHDIYCRSTGRKLNGWDIKNAGNSPDGQFVDFAAAAWTQLHGDSRRGFDQSMKRWYREWRQLD